MALIAPIVGGLVACGGDDSGDPELILESEAAEVAPTAETDPVPRGGDADDPAIWIHPTDRAKSTVLGTDKRGGLAVYDLAGNQIQYLRVGDLNNVDLRPGFPLGGESVTLVTAADRATDSLSIYRVDESTGRLVDVASRRITVGIAAYGSCMYKSPKTDKYFLFVNSEDEGDKPGGEVEQWELFDDGRARVDARKVRDFAVESDTEGCVADDVLSTFYLGEEETGIWKYGAEPDAGAEKTQVDSTARGGHLKADVEGLTLAYTSDQAGYVIASSQGNRSFVVYRREGSNEYVKTFRVGSGGEVDAVEDSDGIDVTTEDLGSAFPHGLLVVHDGHNGRRRTNFKLVPLAP